MAEKNGTAEFNNGYDSERSTRFYEAAQKYMQDLIAERTRMEADFPLATKLIDDAIERVKLTGRIPSREQYADVYQQRPLKLTQKVYVPIKDKKFNYVGKLLGPNGNSLRRLQEESQCKIAICGRSSMKDREREEELRNSGDPKYSHLNSPLHVEISAIAAPAESYARIAYALAEIRKYLIPDKNDEISHEQFRELLQVDPQKAKRFEKNLGSSANTNTSKYLNIVKRTVLNTDHYEEPEEEEEYEYEYEPRLVKRQLQPPPAGYEYVQARPVGASSMPTYKRPQQPMYGTEVKRAREAPIHKQPFKPICVCVPRNMAAKRKEAV